MTDPQTTLADPVPCRRAIRPAGMAFIVLAPILAGCGGMLGGAPYAGDVEPASVDPVPEPGFEVTVEPPEETVEPLPNDPEGVGEEVAPPIEPQSAVPPEDGAAVAAATAPLPRPPSPQTFPNLADVPERPTDLPPLEERRRVLAELQADRAQAAGQGDGPFLQDAPER